MALLSLMSRSFAPTLHARAHALVRPRGQMAQPGLAIATAIGSLGWPGGSTASGAAAARVTP